MKPIGVFGGTFDPIHFGHIEPVLEVCRATGISEVRYVPNSRPGHRSQPGTDARHRWHMTLLALEGHRELIADDREIRRTGISYTVPTLRSMRSEFGLRPLCLILGIDAFLQIHRWHWWADVLKLANVIVMDRPGTTAPHQLPGWWARALNSNPRVLYETMSGNIIHIAVNRVDISATDIRYRFRHGQSVAGLLPDSVSDHIEQIGLYSEKGGTA